MHRVPDAHGPPAGAVFVLLAACGDGDARTAQLDPGVDRDSALTVLSGGIKIDSTRMPAPGAWCRRRIR
jgi:hypothetical protein